MMPPMSRLVVAMEELVEVGDIWSEEAGGNSDGFWGGYLEINKVD